MATASGPEVTANSNSVWGSQPTTVTVVDQRRSPFLLVPVKTAPRAGPVAPFAHLPPAFSGDHSPIRGRSETSIQTFSAGAAMSRVTAVG